MAIVTLEEAKTHLRVDGNDDDAYISTLIAAAESLVKTMTGKELTAEHPLAKVLVLLIVGDWYDNRVITGTSYRVGDKIRDIVSLMVSQISLSEDYPVVGGTV